MNRIRREGNETASGSPKKARRLAPGAHVARWNAWAVLLVSAFLVTIWMPRSLPGAQGATGVLLPDGREFVSWEKPLQFTKTYYVDNRNPTASDANPGTKELPFLTINKAAQVLQPGERAVVMSGIYRERVSPARGGVFLEASQDRNMLDHNIIRKVGMGKGGAAYNIPPHGGWGIITDGTDEAVIAHNLFGYSEDAGVKPRPAGPLLQLPTAPATIGIDPRSLAR